MDPGKDWPWMGLASDSGEAIEAVRLTSSPFKKRRPVQGRRHEEVNEGGQGERRGEKGSQGREYMEGEYILLEGAA